MNEKSILVLEDEPESYGAANTVQVVAKRHGFRLVFADPKDPIASGLAQLRQDAEREFVGVITDSFDKAVRAEDSGTTPFWHIREVRRLRPDLTIVLYSGDLPSRKKTLAREAGADGCFHKGESLGPILQLVAGRAHLADLSPSDRFWQDFPGLLETKFGKWVVYTSAGKLMEGDNEIELYERCRNQGLEHGTYVVAQVLPDQPVAELRAEWLGP